MREDVKDLLERAVGWYRPRSIGPDDVSHRVERRYRVQRVTTAVVALGMFAAVGVFTWRTFEGGEGSRGRQPAAVSYPSPPVSGYYVLFPSDPEPLASGDGARIVALTNLPDGTLYAVSETAYGSTRDDSATEGWSCCHSVKDGTIELTQSDPSCSAHIGAIGTSSGFSVTITVAVHPDIYPHSVLPGGEWTPPEQPDEVLQVLGRHFENLSGDQVVVTPDGDKQLVATASYGWPQPQCGGDPLPMFGGPDCEPMREQLQGSDLKDAMTEVMGALSQGGMCEFWGTMLPPDVEAQHPWPEFAAEWRDWLLRQDFSDARSNAGWTLEPLTWHVVEQEGDRYVVEVTNHDVAIAQLVIDALSDYCPDCDPNVVPFWGVMAWTLYQ